MSVDRLRNLTDAVKSADLNKVQGILHDYPELLGVGDPDSLETGYQLLIEAISLGNNDEIVQLLIESGADPNFKNPLKNALINANDKCIEVFLKKGARFTGSEWQGKESAAHLVFTRHDTCKKILLLLFSYGLEVSFCAQDGKNLLHLFAFIVERADNDGQEIAKILLDSGVPLDEPCRGTERYTPLMYAIRSQNVDLISYLIEKGADVNFKSSNEGIFPLYLAVNDELSLSTKIANLLISHGTEINAKTSKGYTSLHEACNKRNVDIISLLLFKGADINAMNEEQCLPFSYICPNALNEPGGVKCINVFIKEIVKRNSFGDSSIEPLHMDLIRCYSKCRKHYLNFYRELTQMKNTRFYVSHTYYSVLKMYNNINKLANLTKNPEFVENFERGLLFNHYQNDLRQIFDEAIKQRDEIQIVYSRLKLRLRDSFPDVVLRIMAENLKSSDLPSD